MGGDGGGKETINCYGVAMLQWKMIFDILHYTVFDDLVLTLDLLIHNVILVFVKMIFGILHYTVFDDFVLIFILHHIMITKLNKRTLCVD